MDFTFIVLLISLIMSYAYILRYRKSKIRITLAKRDVYKKYIITATGFFVAGFLLSLYVESGVVTLIYAVSLGITLSADYYVFKRYTISKVEK